jgi:hypothetical protein
MLTITAEAVVVELSRLARRLTCSSHISSELKVDRFSRRGVRAAEKISEVGFLYGNPGRHAQTHTNHIPPFHSAYRLRLGVLLPAESIGRLLERCSGLPALLERLLGRVLGAGY